MKRILLLCAMPEELELLQRSLSFENAELQEDLPWKIFKHPTLDIYATITGIGKVNAAASCSVAITMLKPDYIIGIGVAGGVSPKLKIGDIVISSSAIQYDVDATEFGYNIGEVPGMGTVAYSADETLYNTALKVAKHTQIDAEIILGQVMSGDCFVSGSQGKKIYETFRGTSVDMESAAWAQVAHIHNTPWVILRSISDQADGKAHVDYNKFLPKAVHNISLLVEGLIKEVS